MRWRVLFFLVPLCTCLADVPVVSKVEPPDWFTDSKGITLRMLVTGNHLAGATVRAPFRTDRVVSSRSGTHLFFDLQVPPGVSAGRYDVHIQTADGTVDAPFSIVPALRPDGRFQGFSPDDVIYLIMPDRFANGDLSNDDPSIAHGLHDRSKSRYYHGGDLEGIIQHLPYLKALGVTAIWMTPVYDNSNQLNFREKYDNQPITDYHGYGAVDFYAVDEHFGTVEKYRELVDKAHALGMKVIQDEVANHTGPYHPWVNDPPTTTWFNGTESDHLNETWQTWTLMDPHATAELRKSTLDGWFANILPDLNQDDPECAQYLIQNTLWWIGRAGFDGIREDTLPYVPRTFWNRWTAAIRAHYPKVNVVGEVFDGDPGLVSFFQGGRKQFDGVDSGVDTVFDFPLHYALRKAFTGAAPLTELSKVLAHDWMYRDANQLVTFVDLHDVSRFMNQPGATVDGLKSIFTYLLAARGIPMIYYGDEIGMKGGDDPDNRRDFPGGWKEDSRNAFDRSGRSEAEESLIGHLQRLGRLRSELEPLREGKMVELFADADHYAFVRTTAAGAALVVFNRSDQAADLHIPLKGTPIREGVSMRDAIGTAPEARTQGGTIEVHLPPRSSAIFR